MAFSKWVLVVTAAIVGLGFLISMVVLRKDRQVVSRPLSKINSNAISRDGVKVPVLRTYSGLKRLAPVTFIENKLRPQLTLFEDHFEYRVLRKRRVRYSKVEAVHSYTSKTYNKLQIDFSHSTLFFMVVFANPGTLRSVIDFFGKKGIYPHPGNRC